MLLKRNKWQTGEGVGSPGLFVDRTSGCLATIVGLRTIGFGTTGLRSAGLAATGLLGMTSRGMIGLTGSALVGAAARGTSLSTAGLAVAAFFDGAGGALSTEALRFTAAVLAWADRLAEVGFLESWVCSAIVLAAACFADRMLSIGRKRAAGTSAS